MPGTELAMKLTGEVAMATCGRLARSTITLPSSLFKLGDPSAQATEEYLSNLLDHAPASFLERYGKHLTEDELAAFQPLCHDYEVQFWVTSLQSTRTDATATTSGQVQRIAVSTKNRRLAAMQRLHEAGEYFSVESMQERDPSLYHHYIGQYIEVDEDVQQDEVNEEMVREFQQAQLRARMEQLQEEAMEEQVSEHESDDSETEGPAAAAAAPMQVDEQPAQPRPPRKGPAILGIPAGRLKHAAKKPVGRSETAGVRCKPAAAQHGRAQQHAEPPTRPSVKAKPGKAGSSVRFETAEPAGQACHASGAHGRAAKPAQEDTQRHDTEDQQRQFVQEMEARFLSGGDAAFVDYATIDADVQLDDHWLEQRGRDAEDAYFDDEPADDSVISLSCVQQRSHLTAGGAEDDLEEWELMALDNRSRT